MPSPAQECYAKELVEIAADYLLMPAERFYQRERMSEPATRARDVVWLVLRRRGWSLVEIGALFDRDHSTVHHGINRTTARLRTDQELRLLRASLLEHREADDPVDASPGLLQEARALIARLDQAKADIEARVRELEGVS